LRIAKLEIDKPNPAYFLNIGSFYYGINRDVWFIKVIYEDTTSYVFPNFENGLSSISMMNDTLCLVNFDEILSNAANMLTYDDAMKMPSLKIII
jgi:hypothetical protein